MARPAPSRPPETAIRYMDGIAQHDAIVKELQDRINVLEQALGERSTGSSSNHTGSPHSSSSSSLGSVPLPDVRDASAALRAQSRARSTETPARALSDPPRVVSSYGEMDLSSTVIRPLPNSLYETICYRAHMCLAQHGEFIGRGSIMCALHSVSKLILSLKSETSLIYQL